MKALLDTSNRAEARISKAREAGDGDGSNRAIRNIRDSLRRIATGEEGVPSVSQTALRVPTIEHNLVVTDEHVQQAIREKRTDTYWNTPPPPRIQTPSSDQVRFRQKLDNPVLDSMSKLDIGPQPALPLERDLESQLEYVPMVEVVRAEDREAVVEAERRDGRRNDGGVAKPKPRTTKLHKHRKKKRQSQAKQKWNDSQNQSK